MAQTQDLCVFHVSHVCCFIPLLCVCVCVQTRACVCVVGVQACACFHFFCVFKAVASTAWGICPFDLFLFLSAVLPSAHCIHVGQNLKKVGKHKEDVDMVVVVDEQEVCVSGGGDGVGKW